MRLFQSLSIYCKQEIVKGKGKNCSYPLMIKIQKIEHSELIKLKDDLSSLLFPGYQPLLEKPDLLDPQNQNLIVFGAFDKEIPVGLIVGNKTLGRNSLDIQSLFVFEKYKDQHLQYQLVKQLEEEYIKKGGSLVQALYPNRSPFLEEWEQPFIKLGWNGRSLSIIECYYENGDDFNPPWFEKNLLLPPNFEIFPWGELTSQDKSAILKAYEQRAIPEDVYPFAGDGVFEPLNSLGLRYQGNLIGWLITRRLDADTICYYSIYVDFDFHHKGPIIVLLSRALRLQQKAGIKHALFRVNLVQLPNLKWYHFVKRRLAPYADRYTEFYLAWHKLN